MKFFTQISRNNGLDKTYSCNRSGFYRPNFQKRATKARGTIKEGKICPAFIRAKVNMLGEVEVLFSVDFHSHSLKKFPTLPRLIRNEVKSMIKLGMSDKNVIKKVNRTYTKFHFNQKHVMNIKQKYGINKFIHSPNDMTSVQIFERTRKQKFLYCSLSAGLDQRTEIAILPGKKNVAFPKKAIFAMDSTHKTTFYGFYLTTLGLIDKNKTFTPIAWLISSDEKKCSIEKFLSSVFEATKMPTELALVTDDTPIYIDVFKKLCTGSVTHILCRWHLEKNFKKYSRKYSGQNFSKSLWHFNRIMNSQSAIELKENMKLFEAFCSEFPKLFAYFQNSCMRRKEKWAPYLIRDYSSRTNMSVEAFHKVLKYNYFDGKRNRRCDLLIQALFDYYSDRFSIKARKIEKYGFQNRVTHSYHYKSKSMSFAIEESGPNSFILSVTHNQNVFITFYFASQISKPSQSMCLKIPVIAKQNVHIVMFAHICLSAAAKYTSRTTTFVLISITSALIGPPMLKSKLLSTT